MFSRERSIPAWIWLVPLFILFSGEAVNAEPVDVEFAGVIETVDDPGALLPAGISVGTPFSGTYTYDSVPAGTPVTFGPVEWGCWSHPVLTESAQLTVTVGSNVLNLAAPTNVIICDNNPNAGPHTWGTPTTAFNGVQPGVGFNDTTATRISDPTDYFVNTSLSGWTGGVFRIFDSDNPSPSGLPVLASGAITTLQIAQPEPVPSVRATGLVVLAGALVLLGVIVTRRNPLQA